MSTSTLNAQTRGFGLSVAITCIANAVLVWIKESSPGLQNVMKSITGHHWMTHGLFDIILFVVLGLLLAKGNGGQGPAIEDDKLLRLVVGGFLLGCVLIVAFYVIIG